MEIREILLVGVTFLNVSLGILIYWNNKKNWTNIFFGLLALSLSFWTLGMYMYTKSPIDYDRILLWSRVLYFAGISVAYFFIFFSYSFPEGILRVKKIIFFLITLFYLIVGYFTLFSSRVIADLIVDGSNRILVHGIFYPLYFSFFFLGMLWALYILFYKYRSAEGNLKTQLKIMIGGTSIPIAFAGVINMFLPLFHNFYYAWTGPLSSFVLIGFISYGIIKNRLMNVRLIATEIFSIGITLLTLIQIFDSASTEEVLIRGAIFIFTFLFAILLIRSVLKEVKRREEMESLASQLSKATKQLKKANVQLKKLDEAKSEFISIASHQLRTPLTAIKGYGSMLLEGDFGEVKELKHREAINTMVVSSQRLTNLVENLLSISRIESGRLKFDFKDLQLTDLVGEIVNNLQKNAKEKGLYLKLEKSAQELPLVNMDDEKIRQIVINFIDNSIKYTKKGGITVKLKKEKDLVTCCVQDTGIGISEEEQAQLFKKFSRGKDAFLINTEGNGLGLYVANMMIKEHKGKIWVESDGVGKGSRFCFSLPIKRK